MDRLNFSAKHLAISKASAQIVIAVGAASFITVFCLVAAKTVLSQYQYQGRVIAAVKKADNQLNSDVVTYNGLTQSYTKFNKESPNIIGNPVTGTANDNTQVILDALPGAYDFPALATTLQYILTTTGLQQDGSISGTDDQLSQGSVTSSSNPQPVSMPFSISAASASSSSVQNLLQYLQQSTRPMPVDNLSLSGSQGDLTMSVAAHTYYQPAKTLSISKESVN